MTHASQLASALLEDEESPKEFLNRHQAGPDRRGYVNEYSIRCHGLDGMQYFPGVSTYHSSWDSAYAGMGDNPKEALDDALTQAAEDGWQVAKIENKLPEHPSAAAEVRDSVEEEAIHNHPEWADLADDDPAKADLDDYVEQELETIESELAYYVVLWLRGNAPRQEAEEETPKQFLRRVNIYGLPHPENFPELKRWRGHASTQAGVAYRYKPVRGIRSTQLRHFPKSSYMVRYHNTDVLHFAPKGCFTHTGGFHSKTTFDRMNRYLPHGWRIFQHQFKHYWYNIQWPESVKNDIWRVQRRRGHPDAHFINYHDGDWIDNIGNLHASHNQYTVTTDAKIAEVPADEGAPVVEGRYQKELDWITKVRKKHDKMRQIKHIQNKIENVDEPDKRKKRWNLH